MSVLKQKKFLIILFLIVLLSVPYVGFAAGLVPCGGTNEQPCTISDIFVLIAKVINFLIGTAGVYAVFQIINAGFWLIVSSGDEEKIRQWKTGLTNAVVGFVVVLLSFVLINTTVNILLSSRCQIDLKNPLSYLSCNK